MGSLLSGQIEFLVGNKSFATAGGISYQGSAPLRAKKYKNATFLFKMVFRLLMVIENKTTLCIDI